MRGLLTSLAICLALPAGAEQVVTLVPANFTLSSDPVRKLCIARDHVLSARKEGIDVLLVMDDTQRVELTIAPDGFSGSAYLARSVLFTFEDSLQIKVAATLADGRYLMALQKADAPPSDLWVALRRRDYTIVSLPRKPADRFGIDLRTMPSVFAALQACQRGMTQ